MDGEQRRREIMDVLRTTKAPVSGAFLEKSFMSAGRLSFRILP